MIELTKKKHSIYTIIGIIILLVFQSLTFYYKFLFPYLTLSILIITPILFVLLVEKITFNGRNRNIDSLVWLFHFLCSIIAYLLIYMILYLTSKYIFNVRLTGEINKAIGFPIYNIFIYFTFKFFQLLYKRLQDFNQPGYYLIGIFPVISWFIGIRIYKSGYRFLGILVFLNLVIAFVYILIISGTNGTNYFGVNPRHIYQFKKAAKRIRNAKSLDDSEREKLKKELVEKFCNIELEEKEEFKNKEIVRLIRKEKLKVDKESKIDQKRKEFYEKIVLEQLEKRYLKTNWC